MPRTAAMIAAIYAPIRCWTRAGARELVRKLISS